MNAPIPPSTALVIGDRIRLSELGRRRSPKTPEFGTVVRVSRSGTSFVVLLDGRLRPIRLHWTYVEPLGELDVTADRFAMR